MVRRGMIVIAIFATATPWTAAQPLELRWAGDPEGGAPYVEASPADPNLLVGFDVEVAIGSTLSKVSFQSPVQVIRIVGL